MNASLKYKQVAVLKCAAGVFPSRLCRSNQFVYPIETSTGKFYCLGSWRVLDALQDRQAACKKILQIFCLRRAFTDKKKSFFPLIFMTAWQKFFK